jgi:hypothetical protein
VKLHEVKGEVVLVELSLDELDSIGGLLREAVYGIGKTVTSRVGISESESEKILLTIRAITKSAEEIMNSQEKDSL